MKPKAAQKIKHEMRNIVLLTIGTAFAAFGYCVFQVPFNIAAGGISGLGIVINHFTGWPIGLMFLTANVPLLFLGFFSLGRWAFVFRTALAILVFSAAVDACNVYLPRVLPTFPVTHDVLLCSVYAGIIGGVGNGLVYRAGCTMGGTAIIGRIIQFKTGLPLSQAFLYSDGFIVLLAGAVFGWELALYAMLTLFLTGIASDYTLEGPSSVRTVTIVTTRANELSKALMSGLGRSLSQWQIIGSFSGEQLTMLTCTLFRPQVEDMKRIVAEVDPTAFVTIGVARQAIGSNFVSHMR